MAKQSQQIVAALLAMLVLCVAMAGQADAARPAPAPYMRGYEPAYAPSNGAPEYAPSYAPEGSPMSAPVVASPAYAPSGPSSAEGLMLQCPRLCQADDFALEVFVSLFTGVFGAKRRKNCLKS